MENEVVFTVSLAIIWKSDVFAKMEEGLGPDKLDQ